MLATYGSVLAQRGESVSFPRMARAVDGSGESYYAGKMQQHEQFVAVLKQGAVVRMDEAIEHARSHRSISQS